MSDLRISNRQKNDFCLYAAQKSLNEKQTTSERHEWWSRELHGALEDWEDFIESVERLETLHPHKVDEWFRPVMRTQSQLNGWKKLAELVIERGYTAFNFRWKERQSRWGGDNENVIVTVRKEWRRYGVNAQRLLDDIDSWPDRDFDYSPVSKKQGEMVGTLTKERELQSAEEWLKTSIVNMQAALERYDEDDRKYCTALKNQAKMEKAVAACLKVTKHTKVVETLTELLEERTKRTRWKKPTAWAINRIIETGDYLMRRFEELGMPNAHINERIIELGEYVSDSGVHFYD